VGVQGSDQTWMTTRKRTDSDAMRHESIYRSPGSVTSNV
jgi:hypothetical protein